MRPSSIVRIALLVFAAVLLTAGASFAADAYLVTQQVVKTGLPGGGTATMWVYACDPTAASGTNTACVASTVSATGPTINVPAGTTSLTIHVRNTLSAPVSVVIPGLPGGGVGVPVFDPGTGRVRSFTHEVAGGSTGAYTWTAASGALKPGTYLYESGTHPSIQVPMGLYGALIIREAVANTAYGEIYNFEVPLLFSEIDPVQNAAVAAAAGIRRITPAQWTTTQLISLSTAWPTQGRDRHPRLRQPWGLQRVHRPRYWCAISTQDPDRTPHFQSVCRCG